MSTRDVIHCRMDSPHHLPNVAWRIFLRALARPSAFSSVVSAFYLLLTVEICGCFALCSPKDFSTEIRFHFDTEKIENV